MPPRKSEAGPGQIALPSLEPHPALVHILTPEYVGLIPKEFEDITQEHMIYAAPELLRASLIDIRRDGRSAVGYMPAGGSSELWIAVSPTEFRQFARHIPKLAQTAINGTLAANEENMFDDEVQAKVTRSARHAVEGRGVRMAEHLEKTRGNIELIDVFKEMTKHPNLARGNTITMQARFNRLRKDVIGGMVKALGNQREWNKEQSILAERTIIKSLYLHPDLRLRKHNFESIMDLAGDYYGHKQALLLTRLFEVRKYLKNNNPA